MTDRSDDIGPILVDKAKSLADHDGVPYGITHLIAAAEHLGAAIRREMDKLISEFVPHGMVVATAPLGSVPEVVQVEKPATAPKEQPSAAEPEPAAEASTIPAAAAIAEVEQ